MAERTLKKRRRPNLPVVLLRPSIIISAYMEPIEGWTDTFSAAGGISLAGGTGIVNFVRCSKENVCDLIPVDFVSNSILVSTALEANIPQLTVINCGTSHQNPVTWYKYLGWALDYLKTQPFSMQAFTPNVRFVSQKPLFDAMFFMKNDLPARIYN
jgi:fatty acyl-CoA reductase